MPGRLGSQRLKRAPGSVQKCKQNIAHHFGLWLHRTLFYFRFSLNFDFWNSILKIFKSKSKSKISDRRFQCTNFPRAKFRKWVVVKMKNRNRVSSSTWENGARRTKVRTLKDFWNFVSLFSFLLLLLSGGWNNSYDTYPDERSRKARRLREASGETKGAHWFIDRTHCLMTSRFALTHIQTGRVRKMKGTSGIFIEISDGNREFWKVKGKQENMGWISDFCHFYEYPETFCKLEWRLLQKEWAWFHSLFCSGNCLFECAECCHDISGYSKKGRQIGSYCFSPVAFCEAHSSSLKPADKFSISPDNAPFLYHSLLAPATRRSFLLNVCQEFTLLFRKLLQYIIYHWQLTNCTTIRKNPQKILTVLGTIDIDFKITLHICYSCGNYVHCR